MRIISKYNDYYDIGISYGVDKELVFERYQYICETEIQVEYRPKIIYLEKSNFELKLYFKYIVFCKEIYPFIQIEEIKYKIENKKRIQNILKREYIYAKDEMIDFLKQYKKTLDYTNDYFIENITNFFNDKYIKSFLCVNTNSPYFLIEPYEYVGERNIKYLKYKYTCNPILKNYKFIKVLKPLKAYQKITMYLGEIKANENSKSLNIDEKYLIKAKGFNKYSFRKSK